MWVLVQAGNFHHVCYGFTKWVVLQYLTSNSSTQTLKFVLFYDVQSWLWYRVRVHWYTFLENEITRLLDSYLLKPLKSSTDIHTIRQFIPRFQKLIFVVHESCFAVKLLCLIFVCFTCGVLLRCYLLVVYLFWTFWFSYCLVLSAYTKIFLLVLI